MTDPEIDWPCLSPEHDDTLGRRAARTRAAIIDAGRTLFLERGYDGTKISHITDAVGISRAAFYTYFKDKRDVFGLLGVAAFQDMQDAVERFTQVPDPATVEEVTAWVRTYFDFMDAHGAFLHAASQSFPDDDPAQELTRRMQMRVATDLGRHMADHGAAQPAEALGIATLAMLNRSWHGERILRLPVDGADMARMNAELIHSFLVR